MENITYFRVLSFRNLLLEKVSKREDIKAVIKGLFFIGYFYLLKYFFLLPLIIPDYNLIVNINGFICISIMFVGIYSFFNEVLYPETEYMDSQLVMMFEVCFGLILTALGVIFSI